MNYARASVHYTIVVRTAALSERNVALADLLGVFEVSAPQGDAEGVLTFYFVFAPEVPEWCRFGAALTRDFN